MSPSPSRATSFVAASFTFLAFAFIQLARADVATFGWRAPRSPSRVGVVAECADHSPTARRLCGAIAACAIDRLIYVASSRFNGVAIVDSSDAEAMALVGSWSSSSSCANPVAIAAHASSTYVVVLARGDERTKRSFVVVIEFASGGVGEDRAAPRAAANASDCELRERGRTNTTRRGVRLGTGEVEYSGTLCGATAMDVDSNVAFVAVGDCDRLTAVALPSDVANADSEPMVVLGSVQSDELRNARMVIVVNGVAYVKSDGVCDECVATVDVSDPTAMTATGATTMDAVADIVPKWRWFGTLASGAHRSNATFPYDWIVDPVRSSVTSVARECVDAALEIGDAPSACVGRDEFAYASDVNEASAYSFSLEL